MSDPSSLRLVFAGTPDFAATHLAALLKQGVHQVVAVYCQPDRRSGRGKRARPGPVKQLALEHDLPVYQPATLGEPDRQAELAALAPDVMEIGRASCRERGEVEERRATAHKKNAGT